MKILKGKEVNAILKRLGMLGLLGFLLMIQNTYALDATRSGFYYPIGTASFLSGTGTWLGTGNGNGGDHLGVDMWHDNNSVGENVFSIADGIVEAYSLNGWGDDNIAVLIRHTLANGKSFLALYGHIKKTTAISISKTVLAGQNIGITGKSTGPIHLHFGVVMPDKSPEVGYGYSHDLDHNNFIDPIDFIINNVPVNENTGDIFGDRQIRFGDVDFIVECIEKYNSSCNREDIVLFQECIFEKSTLCDEDTLKVTLSVGGGGSPITSPSPQPIDGKRVDLNIDSDIKRDGKEISASSDTYIPREVEVYQDIELIHQTQVRNADTKPFLRDSGSESIEGPIFYKIDGIFDWTLYESPEFKISDLKKNDNPDKIEVAYHFRIIQEDTIFLKPVLMVTMKYRKTVKQSRVLKSLLRLKIHQITALVLNLF